MASQQKHSTMEMTATLCTNCYHKPECTLRNGRAVFSCEEHFSTFAEPTFAITEEPALKHFTGLCGNCELKDDCHWRNDDIITFHCEHYL